MGVKGIGKKCCKVRWKSPLQSARYKPKKHSGKSIFPLAQYSPFVLVDNSVDGKSARRPVSRVLSDPAQKKRGAGTAIPLGRASLRASRDQPGQQGGNAPASRGKSPVRAAGHPYSVLLPVGFTLPPLLPGARCALTAPFHPCRLALVLALRRIGGLFSVALSLGSPPPAVSRHRVPVEPGLSSTPARTPAEPAP